MAKQTFSAGQVLTAAQMTSLQQTAMLGGAASAKTASYTLVAADAGTAISMSNASATTITVNTALFAAGDTVHITNLGAGVCTITAGTATVNSSASLALAQYESGFLDFTSTSAAIFVKGAGAAASSGGMTLLSTTTLSGASTAVSVTPTGYVNLYVEIIGMQNATANYAPLLRMNNDATAINYIGYSIWVKEQSGTTRGLTNDLTNNQNGQDAIALYAIGEAGLKPSNANNFTQFTVHNPNSTNRKLVRGSQGFFANNDVDFWQNFDVDYRGTSAISSINIIAGSGTFTAGTVYVYGVK